MTQSEVMVFGGLAALLSAPVINHADWSFDAKFIVAAGVGAGVTGLLSAIELIRFHRSGGEHDVRSWLGDEQGDEQGD